MAPVATSGELTELYTCGHARLQIYVARQQYIILTVPAGTVNMSTRVRTNRND